MTLKNKLVSVIVTTKNEEKNIDRLLSSIQNQSYPAIETILVDNNSTDKTIEITKQYKVKTVNWGPERSAQRNYGAKVSKGEFIFFLDADMELSKNVIEKCVQQIEKDKKNGGVIIPEESVATTFWEKVKAYERSFYNSEGDSATDAARFFRKTAFNKADGYDESITGPEDWDLPESIKKLGYKIVRASALIYHYEKIQSLLSLARKKYYYARRAHRYLKKQKISVFSPKTIYFLRPVFYRDWKRQISHPILTLAMIIMFSVELFAGGLGFIVGKLNHE